VQREYVGDGAVQGCRYGFALTKFDHASGEPTDLQRIASLEIVVHLGSHVIGHVVRELEAHLGVVLGQVHAVGPTNRNNLAHYLMQEGACL
jgi:hypothetical protein